MLHSDALARWTSERDMFEALVRSTLRLRRTHEQALGERLGQASAWRNRGWLAAVDHLDAILRSCYGVQEYTDSRDCVFRIATARACRPVRLSDGTLVQAGEMVGSLHFWNEHLPPFPPSGPDLHWAKLMRTRMRHSLELLCTHVQTDPAWQGINAICADTPLPFRPLARQQMLRLATRHGFEAEDVSDQCCSRASAVAHNLLLWGIARAYNPSALVRFSLRQGRQPLWLSRRSLLSRYGSGRQRCGAPDTLG